MQLIPRTGIHFRFTPNPIAQPKRFNFYQNQTLEMGSQPQQPQKRPTCPSCSKPIRLCLCSRFKTPLFDNSISVTILQHNHEKNHPLNSTRIAALGLKNLSVATVSDVHFEAKFLIKVLKPHQRLGDTPSEICRENGEESTGECDSNDMEIAQMEMSSMGEEEEPDITATIAKCGFTCSLMRLRTFESSMEKPDFDKLFASQVGKDAITNGFSVKRLLKDKLDGSFEDEDSEEFNIVIPPRSALLFPTKKSINLEVGSFEVENLIVLDGTWAKAKRMYHENPWLKLLPHLKLDINKTSLYREVRHQPKVGCLSTVESIVCAMKALGDDSVELDNLLDVFESMVVDQRRCKDERVSREQTSEM